MTTSGDLDDARNRPNKIVLQFALAYKFRLRTHTRTKNFKARAAIKGAAEKRVPRISDADRAMLGSAQFAKRAWGYAEPIAWLRRTHCMAT